MISVRLLLVIGFLMNFINLGKLPGDIIIKKGNTTFYFPIVTSIIIKCCVIGNFYIIVMLIGQFR